MKPVPKIRDPEAQESPEVSHMKTPISIPWRSPKKQLFQEDQYATLMEFDLIRSFDNINKKLTPARYTLIKYDKHLVF